jgi:hypothetical protein
MSESDDHYCLNCFNFGRGQPWYILIYFTLKLLLSCTVKRVEVVKSESILGAKPRLLSCWGRMKYEPTVECLQMTSQPPCWCSNGPLTL